jgi:putative phosphoesterase
MRIGVVSDTHGKPECFRWALEQMGEIDLLIHAGDHYQDAINMGKEKGIRIIAVTGNCDWLATGPAEEEIEIMGYHILVTHGHTYGVKANNFKLAEKLKHEKYNLIICGHSHVPEITCLSGGYLLNPGSPSLPRRGSYHSFGIVEIGVDGIVPYIYELKRQR